MEDQPLMNIVMARRYQDFRRIGALIGDSHFESGTIKGGEV